MMSIRHFLLCFNPVSAEEEIEVRDQRVRVSRLVLRLLIPPELVQKIHKTVCDSHLRLRVCHLRKNVNQNHRFSLRILRLFIHRSIKNVKVPRLSERGIKSPFLSLVLHCRNVGVGLGEPN